MSKRAAVDEKELGERKPPVEQGVARVEARVRDKEYAFDVPLGGNLLSAALRNKVPVDHLCRVGLCGICQVRVAWGDDSLSEPSDAETLLLDEMPLSEGVRLACQAKVLDDLGIEQSDAKRQAPR